MADSDPKASPSAAGSRAEKYDGHAGEAEAMADGMAPGNAQDRMRHSARSFRVLAAQSRLVDAGRSSAKRQGEDES